jgi:hypothetical protein
MSNGEHDDWNSEKHKKSQGDEKNLEIQRMFAEMEKKAKSHINYMLLEGFIEPTEEKGIYKYTAEGLVLAHQRYKSLRQQGLL